MDKTKIVLCQSCDEPHWVEIKRDAKGEYGVCIRTAEKFYIDDSYELKGETNDNLRSGKLE